jgi:hypothetical protein
MDYANEIIEQIELHSIEGMRNCFDNGVSPNMLFKEAPLLYELTSEYTRSPQFKDCVKLFVDYGLQFEDKSLLAVLLNDETMLQKEINNNAAVVNKLYQMRCAYTPLYNVTLLHICAEFNHTACAGVLVKHGADVNATAGFDEYGFGGQTPIFHTVNQNGNQSAEMMQYLLLQKADLELTVKALVWGKGYPWETIIPSVNAVSYAMMGLLPQMHRSESTIAVTVNTLMKHKYGISYTNFNIPNKYLS